LLASASIDGSVRVWDPAAGRLVHTFTGDIYSVNAVCVVPVEGGRHLLASVDDGGSVRVWDPIGGGRGHTRARGTFLAGARSTGATFSVYAVLAVPVGVRRQLLASASFDGSVRVWDPIVGRLVHTLTGHVHSVTALCVVPAEGGRQLLASASTDWSVRVWDPV